MNYKIKLQFGLDFVLKFYLRFELKSELKFNGSSNSILSGNLILNLRPSATTLGLNLTLDFEQHIK